MRSGRRTYFQSGAYYNLKLLLEMLLRRQVRPSLWGSTRAASQTRSHDLRGCEWERCDFGRQCHHIAATSTIVRVEVLLQHTL